MISEDLLKLHNILFKKWLLYKQITNEIELYWSRYTLNRMTFTMRLGFKGIALKI
jgi:hypothetical protein